VQQFFEALGLAKPPRVEISHRTLAFTGAPGAALEDVVQLKTVEKRPIFAHAVSDVAWVKVGKVDLGNRTARVPVQVPAVPVRPGEQLRGHVLIQANGNQRFTVEVVLNVAGKPSAQVPPPVPVLQAVPVGEVASRPEPVRRTDSPPRRRPPEPPIETDAADLEAPPPPTRRFVRAAAHLFPLVALILGLVLTLVHDLSLPAGSVSDDETDPTPYLRIAFHDAPDPKNILPPATMRFGLSMPHERDPENPNQEKLLTFDPRGMTNNTCVRVDGADFLFGEPPGQWQEPSLPLDADAKGRPRTGRLSTWILPKQQLRVTQRVEIVRGETSGRLDTCHVRYTLANLDGRPHQVGLRFLLDTFIGANDGVPFTIPGAGGLCDTQMELANQPPVPDFLQALEKDDLAHPGTVAHLQFRLGDSVETPSRVLLGGWPNQSLRHFRFPEANGELTKWQVPLLRIDELKRRAQEQGKDAPADSAVTMYWAEKALAPGAKREVGFSYGLGDVASGEGGGRLLLTVGGRLVRDGSFTLTALVRNPSPGEKLTLTLPDGFDLLDGLREQDVPSVPAGATRPTSPVTWRIKARKEGRFQLEVRSSVGAAQRQGVTIRSQGIFD
jgi:hypothetical protein